MDTSEHDDWKKFSLTVKHNRKGRKNTKTLTFDLSHVVQPMQMQFVITHDKQHLKEFLENQSASLLDCSHENVILSLESSGTVDEVSVQVTNLIIHFLLEYDTTPFYLSEDEAEQKYGMKKEIRKVCQAFNVNVNWKEESNVIWLIGPSKAVKKCFLSLMTFCQGTSERMQSISQATFVDWEKCKQSAQTALTESEGTISKQKHQEELLALEDRHKMFVDEMGRKHNEELQRLTEEIQVMKKCEDELKTALEATKSEQKILLTAYKDKSEAKLAASQKENAHLKEKIRQLESGKCMKKCEVCMDDVTDPKKLKCGHTFCRDCIHEQFQYKPVCPSCGAVYGKIIGDQPPGTMKVTTSKFGSLQGYEGCGLITIQYCFPPGKQGPDHPQPGQPYEGISRGAYLPNNERGKLICDLLKIAFDRKLVFTIGRSRTTGKEGVVTWNDIHHKTRIDGGPPRYGYPDPTYLDRVMEELKAKGVTEESLNDP